MGKDNQIIDADKPVFGTVPSKTEVDDKKKEPEPGGARRDLYAPESAEPLGTKKTNPEGER